MRMPRLRNATGDVVRSYGVIADEEAANERPRDVQKSVPRQLDVDIGELKVLASAFSKCPRTSRVEMDVRKVAIPRITAGTENVSALDAFADIDSDRAPLEMGQPKEAVIALQHNMITGRMLAIGCAECIVWPAIFAENDGRIERREDVRPPAEKVGVVVCTSGASKLPLRWATDFGEVESIPLRLDRHVVIHVERIATLHDEPPLMKRQTKKLRRSTHSMKLSLRITPETAAPNEADRATDRP